MLLVKNAWQQQLSEEETAFLKVELTDATHVGKVVLVSILCLRETNKSSTSTSSEKPFSA